MSLDGIPAMPANSSLWYARVSVVLPLLLGGIAYVLMTFDVVGPGWVVGILFSSIVIAGVPYALFAVVGLGLLWKRPLSDYVWWAVRAPLVFAPFFILWLFVSRALGVVRGPWDFVAAMVWSFCLIVPIGYVYVGIFLVGLRFVFGPNP